MRLIELEPGDQVQIRIYKHNPAFWDDDYDMYNMMGQRHVVEGQDPESGYYTIVGHPWHWRRKDLIATGVNIRQNSDPNYAFKVKKITGQI